MSTRVTTADRGIYVRKSPDKTRYYVKVGFGKKVYKMPGHSVTLEEARIRRDTLRSRLEAGMDVGDLLESERKAFTSQSALLATLTEAVSNSDAARLGPIASLLLAALQRSRQKANDPLTLGKLLHAPTVWPVFDQRLGALFLQAFKDHYLKPTTLGTSKT